MKKRSLQSIQDYYENLGYKGEKLRKAIEKDEEWKQIVRERRKKSINKISLTKAEKRKYVMSTNEDYEILANIKRLEKLRLEKEDRYFIKFLKTQLEYDWRLPILKELRKLLRKYS